MVICNSILPLRCLLRGGGAGVRTPGAVGGVRAAAEFR